MTNFLIIVLMLLFWIPLCKSRKLSADDVYKYREKVKGMFYHAYDGYLKYAYPLDELRPLSCDGHDTWGSYSLTLVDALDTLLILGNWTEFQRVTTLITETLHFDKDINVSVFETNIRIVGGLLSAHILSHHAGADLPKGWPCEGPLLDLAEAAARKLLPAFDTPTGMPYGTVNLRNGVPDGETPVTCTAGVGTFIIEFGTLSRLTGDPIFEQAALKAIHALWRYRSEINLLGNHIDVKTSKWTALDSGIGAGIDSFLEYLVKGSALLQNPELMAMFKVYKEAIETYLKKEDWYMWTNMKKGTVTFPVFQSLEAFWPGTQSLIGDIDQAKKTIHNYHQVWKQYGFTPEFYNIPANLVQQGREGYPLRPELVESLMYLYQATKDPYLLEVGVDIVESIDRLTKTRCGYATVKSVLDHSLEDKMESFFLAETIKYLYLLFDENNFIHNDGRRAKEVTTAAGNCIIDAGGYIFNTEAHPVDAAVLHCCSLHKVEDDLDIQYIMDNVDLLPLLHLDQSLDSNMWEEWSKAYHKRSQRDLPQTVTSSASVVKSIVFQPEIMKIKMKQELKPGHITTFHIDKDTSIQDLLNSITKLVQTSIPLSGNIQSHSSESQEKLVMSSEQDSIDRLLAQDSSSKEMGSDNISRKDGSGQSGLTSQQEHSRLTRLFSSSPYKAFTCPAQPFHSRFSVSGQIFPKSVPNK